MGRLRAEGGGGLRGCPGLLEPPGGRDTGPLREQRSWPAGGESTRKGAAGRRGAQRGVRARTRPRRPPHTSCLLVRLFDKHLSGSAVDWLAEVSGPRGGPESTSRQPGPQLVPQQRRPRRSGRWDRMGVPEAKGAGSLREQGASEVRGHRESNWGEQLGGGRPSRSSGCVWSREGRVRKGVTWLHRQALVCLRAGRSQRLQPASGKEKQMEPGWEEGSWGAGADLGVPPPDFSAQG